MCNKEDKDLIDTAALKKAVPEERIPHIIEALNEVEQMQKGSLPMKSARQLLRELREE